MAINERTFLIAQNVAITRKIGAENLRSMMASSDPSRSDHR